MILNINAIYLPYVNVARTNPNSHGWSQENSVFVAWNCYCIVPSATDRLQSRKQYACRLPAHLVQRPLDSSAIRIQKRGKGYIQIRYKQFMHLCNIINTCNRTLTTENVREMSQSCVFPVAICPNVSKKADA